MYKYEVVKFIKNLPTPFIKIFDQVKNDLYLNTRSKTQEKSKIPFFKSSRTQKTVKYQGVALWNYACTWACFSVPSHSIAVHVCPIPWDSHQNTIQQKLINL